MMKADIFIVLLDFARGLEKIGQDETASVLRKALAKDSRRKEKT